MRPRHPSEGDAGEATDPLPTASSYEIGREATLRAVNLPTGRPADVLPLHDASAAALPHITPTDVDASEAEGRHIRPLIGEVMRLSLLHVGLCRLQTRVIHATGRLCHGPHREGETDNPAHRVLGEIVPAHAPRPRVNGDSAENVQETGAARDIPDIRLGRPRPRRGPALVHG